MATSVGNVVSVPEALTRVRPQELRYYLGGAHYRSAMEFSERAMGDAAAGFRRCESFVHRVRERVGTPEPAMSPTGWAPEFAAAMDDDLGVPAALAVLHRWVREGNSALETGAHPTAAATAAGVRGMLGVLGVDPLDPHWATGAAHPVAGHALEVLIGAELQRRQQARGVHDFPTADAVRDRLAAAGVQITDLPRGPRWRLSHRDAATRG